MWGTPAGAPVPGDWSSCQTHTLTELMMNYTDISTQPEVTLLPRSTHKHTHYFVLYLGPTRTHIQTFVLLNSKHDTKRVWVSWSLRIYTHTHTHLMTGISTWGEAQCWAMSPVSVTSCLQGSEVKHPSVSLSHIEGTKGKSREIAHCYWSNLPLLSMQAHSLLLLCVYNTTRQEQCSLC